MGEENAERIHNLPKTETGNWPELFREEFVRHRDELKGANGSVKEQLKESIKREEAEDAEAVDPDAWLDGLETMLVGCTDQETLDEVWNSYAQPLIEKGLVMKPDHEKAAAMFEKHIQRIEEKGEQG